MARIQYYIPFFLLFVFLSKGVDVAHGQDEIDTSGQANIIGLGYPLFPGLINLSASPVIKFIPFDRIGFEFSAGYRFAWFNINKNGGSGGTYKYYPQYGPIFRFTTDYYFGPPYPDADHSRNRIGLEILGRKLTQDKYCHLHGGSNGLNEAKRDVRSSSYKSIKVLLYHGLSWKKEGPPGKIDWFFETRWGLGAQYFRKKQTIYSYGMSGTCDKHAYSPPRVDVNEDIFFAQTITFVVGIMRDRGSSSDSRGLEDSDPKELKNRVR